MNFYRCLGYLADLIPVQQIEDYFVFVSWLFYCVSFEFLNKLNFGVESSRLCIELTHLENQFLFLS